MVQVGVRHAKTHFSALLRRVTEGEEIIIMRGLEPVARLVPAHAIRRREFGTERGRLTVPEDLDEPLWE